MKGEVKMSDKRNSNTNSDDFDLDFSKRRETRTPEPIIKPEEIHTPVRNSAPKRSPNKKSNKYKPPKETLLIYTIMAAAILMIVTVVFIISLNSTKNTESGTSDNDSSSLSAYMISGGSTSDKVSSDEVSSRPTISVPTGYKYKYSDDDLFIGDSILSGLSSYDILSTHNVAAEIGFTPYKVHYNTLSDYAGTAVDYAGHITPEHINIMLGSNGLGPNASVSEMIKDYKELIAALREVTPDSKICVISVPPITKDSSAADAAGITKKMVDDTNKQIKKMCTEINVPYFDLNSYLSDDEGYFKKEYAEPDGLHFKKDTYNILLVGVEQIWDKGTQTGGESSQ